MPSIADLFVKLALDDSGFAKDVQISAQKAGDAGGKTLSTSLSAGLKTGARVLAVGAGALFGVATKGALELETATARFTAETGLSGKAAEDAGHAIAEMSKGNLQSISTIGDVLIGVTKNMGLTGAAANAATQQILDFATATGQDATDATKSFDDVLDSWHKTAADMPGIMDQLIAGTQKFGGTVKTSEAAVIALAPAIQGLGGNFNDATAFVNLFETAGLDASSAAKGLQTALKSLKPGQTLDDLIKQVASIEDPTKRAQEAMRIFGVRSGAGLANALQPGITSLDQFTVSTGDAAGATTRAADVIKGTFTNQIKIAIGNVTGALAELGSQFGPAVTGFASLASLMGPTLAGVFTKLGGDTLVKAAAVGAGAALGLAFEGALFLASQVVNAALGVFQALGAAGGPVVVGSATAGAVAGAAFQTAFVLGIAALGTIVADKIEHGLEDNIGNLLGGKMRTPSEQLKQSVEALAGQLGISFDAAMARVIAEGQRTGNSSIPDAIAGVLAAAEPRVTGAGHLVGAAAVTGVAAGYAASIPAAIALIESGNVALAERQKEQWAAAGTAIGEGIPASIAQGALSADSVLVDGIRALRDLMKNGLSPKQLAAQALGHRFGVDLAKGFTSSKIGAVDAARALAVDGIAAIEKAGLHGPKAADKTAELVGLLYASGLNAKEIVAAVKAAGGDLNEAAVDKMTGKTGVDSPPYQGGQSVGSAWLNGLTAAVRAGGSSHSGFANALDDIKSLLFGNSPPPRGPLKDIDKGGFNVGRAWRDSFAAGLGGLGGGGFGGRGFVGSSSLAIAWPDLGDLDGTVHHEHGGTVHLDLTPGAAQALRSAGYDERQVADHLRDFKLASLMPTRRKGPTG